MVVVLNLSFSEGGLIVDAPIDRSQPLVDGSILDKLCKDSNRIGLIPAVHRQVGLLPFAQDAEPFELLTLFPYIALGVLARRAPYLQRRHSGLTNAQFAVHLNLDWQSMAVPAGNIGCPETHHRAGLDAEVLENLVESMAKMDAAVGVRRPIVQDKQRPTTASLSQQLVETHLFPLLESSGLVLG